MSHPDARVLVVDDDETTVRFLADALASAGYVVATARNGIDALHILRGPGAPPELVLLDLDMPQMDGFDLLNTLRHHAATSRIPIVVVTCHHERELKVSCLECGANDYVVKPVDTMELVARVGSHVRTSRVANEWLEESRRDPLTGLLNRRGLRERLGPELRAAERYGHDLAVAFFDVNGFKQINDRFGHPQGDWVLEELANLVSRAVRRTDMAARWGGDEFVLACPSLNRDGARNLIDNIRWRAQRAVPFPGFGIAAGIATLREAESHQRSASQLIDRADREMYRDKADMKARGGITLS